MKPDHIEWNILTREKFDQVGILKELQFREKKAGKCVKLDDGFEDVGPPKPECDLSEEIMVSGTSEDPNGMLGGEESNPSKGKNGKYDRRNQNQRRNDGRRGGGARGRGSKEGERSDGERSDNQTRKPQERNRANKRSYQNSKNHESIGIFVGRIPRTARVKDLKEAIQQRGLRTNNLVWKGVKGFAFLYFDKTHTKLSEEEICNQLKDLKLGESILNVEPDRRSKAKSIENGDNSEVAAGHAAMNDSSESKNEREKEDAVDKTGEESPLPESPTSSENNCNTFHDEGKASMTDNGNMPVNVEAPPKSTNGLDKYGLDNIKETIDNPKVRNRNSACPQNFEDSKPESDSQEESKESLPSKYTTENGESTNSINAT